MTPASAVEMTGNARRRLMFSVLLSEPPFEDSCRPGSVASDMPRGSHAQPRSAGRWSSEASLVAAVDQTGLMLFFYRREYVTRG